MQQGTINVQTENIFPIIKKFLYSDHEIFLRELVSNAVDATSKLSGLASLGDLKQEVGDTSIQITLDTDQKVLTISDKGIGMTEEEVHKYINQIAFSSAEEFLEKFKEVEDGKNIIGHFGLGFYSSFMVADKVEIHTKSYKDAPGVKWTCDGSPNFTMEEIDKTERGTDIILHIDNEENAEFLQEARITELLKKYCKFLPVPIQFGEKPLSDEDKEAGKAAEANIINNTRPAWKQSPSELKDEDYKAFYKELYPFSPDPLFWIHLNVDYPFNLTGVLFFPELKKQTVELQKDKIQLYSNQVFVTDNVEEIVPEYLGLLHGVIDSPDIPLNVSRSYLQSDSNVKKINSHISKKVSDKLKELFKKDRKAFEEKWDSISVFVKYGMLSDEKFFDRSKDFCLLTNVSDEMQTFEEYQEKVKVNQTSKDDKIVMLYTTDMEGQHAYIKAATDAGLDVLKMDTIIDNHYVNFLESKLENVEFKRVDADTVDNLIPKDEVRESVLSEEQQTKVKELFETQVGGPTVMVELKPLSPTDAPVTITRNEFMRRMMDMQKLSGNSGFMGQMPDSFNLVVNTNHPITEKLLKKRIENREKLAKQLFDLALLSQNMLKGEALTDFVERSFDLAAE